MPRPGHRRQVSLFLVTVLLPCLALVVLGIQLMRHESDLFQNRLQEEKQRLAVVVRTALSDQLDRISEGHDQALVFAVAVEDGKLVPPWEDYPGLLPRDTAFQRRIDDAQAEERIDPLAAMDAYRELVQSVEDPFQRYYSELQLARVQEAVGEGDSATASLRAVLEAPDSAVDEFGIHVALYAARLSSRKPGEALLDRVVRLVQRNEWLTPMALSRCRDLSQTLVETASGAEAMRKAADLQRTTLSRIGRQNRFLELSEAFPGLLGQLEEPRGWAPFGEPLLLVGLRGRGREQRLLAVDANELLRSPDFSSGLPDSLRDGIRLTEDWSQGGEVLGPPFSSVRLIFVDSRLMGPFVESMRSRRWFYGVMAGLPPTSTTDTWTSTPEN